MDGKLSPYERLGLKRGNCGSATHETTTRQDEPIADKTSGQWVLLATLEVRSRPSPTLIVLLIA